MYHGDVVPWQMSVFQKQHRSMFVPTEGVVCMYQLMQKGDTCEHNAFLVVLFTPHLPLLLYIPSIHKC